MKEMNIAFFDNDRCEVYHFATSVYLKCIYCTHISITTQPIFIEFQTTLTINISTCFAKRIIHLRWYFVILYVNLEYSLDGDSGLFELSVLLHDSNAYRIIVNELIVSPTILANICLEYYTFILLVWNIFLCFFGIFIWMLYMSAKVMRYTFIQCPLYFNFSFTLLHTVSSTFYLPFSLLEDVGSNNWILSLQKK